MLSADKVVNILFAANGQGRPRAMTEPARRVRRTPEEAKRLILEAAHALVARTGPQGLRLQDIAAEAGSSHPLILHHFGIRGGLLRPIALEMAAELNVRLVT